MSELKENYLKTGRASWPGRRHKAELAGGGGNAMQAKGNKRSQRVSIKSLKEAHFEVEL